MSDIKRTSLYDWHVANGAKMVPFAGYDMPVQYPLGVKAEHLHTRKKAGLFDVSHMGQCRVTGKGAADFLEKLTPADMHGLHLRQCRYTMLMNEDGGIIDDLIITRLADDDFFLVINAGCKDKDIAWIKEQLPDDVKFEVYDDAPMFAVQGPAAKTVALQVLNIDIESMKPMYGGRFNNGGEMLTRTGYTGEDGFEIMPAADRALQVWEALVNHPDVEAIGLGARDSLRLEAGFPLYGHDLDDTTSPIEATLKWTVRKTRLQSCIGSNRIMNEMSNGVNRKRAGIKLLDKGIAREGAKILNEENQPLGTLTSGGYSPSLEAAIGQGYVPPAYAKIGTPVIVDVRGRHLHAEICPLNLVKQLKKGA